MLGISFFFALWFCHKWFFVNNSFNLYIFSCVYDVYCHHLQLFVFLFFPSICLIALWNQQLLINSYANGDVIVRWHFIWRCLFSLIGLEDPNVILVRFWRQKRIGIRILEYTTAAEFSQYTFYLNFLVFTAYEKIILTCLSMT